MFSYEKKHSISENQDAQSPNWRPSLSVSMADRMANSAHLYAI